MAYKKARKLIFLSPDQYYYTQKLNLKNAVFIPLLYDMDYYTPRPSEPHEGLRIFHPTSHIWNIKGNHLLINGFNRAAEIYHDISLTVIKRGEYWNKSEALLKKGGNQVIILEDNQTKESLREYYQNCDVVADQFMIGVTGLIGQEAMGCRKPVLQYCDYDLFDMFYDERPPIINCDTSDDISEALIRFREDKNYLRDTGEKSREWILKHHGENVVEKYIEIYQNIR